MSPPTWLYWPATAGGVTAWTPSDLADLRCWLDASDSATITLSGSSVTLWEDKAGSNDADDVVNTSGTKITTQRPTIVTAAQNSLDAIGFNGSQWFDHNSAKAMLQDRSCAIIAVAMKYGSVSTSTYQFAWTNRKGFASGDTAIRFQLYHRDTNTFLTLSRRLDADSTSSFVETSTAPPYDTNWHVHVALLDWTNGSMEYRIDGTSIGTASYASSGNTSNTDLGTAANADGGTWTAIGAAQRTLRSSVSLSGPLTSGSRIGEMICWAKSSGSYTAAEVQDVEGYLAHKWGLETNLPSGHPYEFAAPVT